MRGAWWIMDEEMEVQGWKITPTSDGRYETPLLPGVKHKRLPTLKTAMHRELRKRAWWAEDHGKDDT